MNVIQPDLESFRKPVLASLPAKFEAKWGKGLWERIAAADARCSGAARAARRSASGDPDASASFAALSIAPRRSSRARSSSRCSAACRSACVTRALGDPLIWTDELSRFLMVWLAVFGWILASRKRIHVRIRFFQDLLPRRAHKAVEIVIQLALAIFGVADRGLQRRPGRSATSISKRRRCRSRCAWMYAPMVLAGAVTALQGARRS